MDDIAKLQALLAVARGDEPADILLKNCKLVNTASYEIEETDVAIFQGLIAGIGNYKARKVLDLEGFFLCPSLIDGHIHIESSLLSPSEFARAVVPWGTGAVVCDPHEIVNVCGTKGIDYMLSASQDIPLDVFVMLPSCVPSSKFETSGADLNAEDLKPYLSHERVIGLAEVMNFPGVIMGDKSVLRKILDSDGHFIDGHAPGVKGKRINAYAAAGIQTDHECTIAEEAEERLRRGMYVLIREGSTAKNLKEIIGNVKHANAYRFALVSDDRHADDILLHGHLNDSLKKAVSCGIDPVVAVAMATAHTANIYGLSKIGIISPGKRANFVLFEDMKSFKPLKVWRSGKLMAEDGKLCTESKSVAIREVSSTVHCRKLSSVDFLIPAGNGPVHVIKIVPDQIVTDRMIAQLPIENGYWLTDAKQGIAKLAVVERHGKTQNIGKGFVFGFDLTKGAIASTVAHDSHNIICAGVTDEDMAAAVNYLIECGGGICVVSEGILRACLPLPIAGLMSELSAEEVSETLENLHNAASSFGCKLTAPFMTLSFLALPVIPKLKLTDKGLFDVEKFNLIELLAC